MFLELHSQGAQFLKMKIKKSLSFLCWVSSLKMSHFPVKLMLVARNVFLLKWINYCYMVYGNL